MSGTGTFPVIVRGADMGGRCGTGRGRFPVRWARMVRTLSPTRSRTTRRTAFAFDPARGLVPLRVWAQEWLERRVIGESTRRNYEGFIHNHLVPRLGREMLARLARRDFEEFVSRTCMPPVPGWRSPRSMTGW